MHVAAFIILALAFGSPATADHLSAASDPWKQGDLTVRKEGLRANHMVVPGSSTLGATWSTSGICILVQVTSDELRKVIVLPLASLRTSALPESEPEAVSSVTVPIAPRAEYVGQPVPGRPDASAGTTSPPVTTLADQECARLQPHVDYHKLAADVVSTTGPDHEAAVKAYIDWATAASPEERAAGEGAIVRGGWGDMDKISDAVGQDPIENMTQDQVNTILRGYGIAAMVPSMRSPVPRSLRLTSAPVRVATPSAPFHISPQSLQHSTTPQGTPMKAGIVVSILAWLGLAIVAGLPSMVESTAHLPLYLAAIVAMTTAAFFWRATISSEHKARQLSLVRFGINAVIASLVFTVVIGALLSLFAHYQ